MPQNRYDSDLSGTSSWSERLVRLGVTFGAPAVVVALMGIAVVDIVDGAIDRTLLDPATGRGHVLVVPDGDVLQGMAVVSTSAPGCDVSRGDGVAIPPEDSVTVAVQSDGYTIASVDAGDMVARCLRVVAIPDSSLLRMIRKASRPGRRTWRFDEDFQDAVATWQKNAQSPFHAGATSSQTDNQTVK